MTLSRTKKALIATGIYVLVVVLLSLYQHENFAKLALNELGDYLAGAFGPLALFWVVVGYFQQGEELRNNANELAASVAELKRQADTNQKRFESERESRAQDLERHKRKIQPHFKIDVKKFNDGEGQRTAEIELTNSGATVRGVVVSVEESGQKQDIYKSDLFKESGVMTFACSWYRHIAFQEIEPVLFEISYQDFDHDIGVIKLKFQVMRGGLTRPRILAPDYLP